MPESSPAACRFAIRDSTAFCLSLDGLLNIDSALTLIRFAGRDNPDRIFFFVIFILHAIHVDDQQHSPVHSSNRVPTLFAIHDTICADDYARIIENKRCSFERDASVLFLVDPIFRTVPFKPHRYTLCITYVGRRPQPFSGQTAARHGGLSIWKRLVVAVDDAA